MAAPGGTTSVTKYPFTRKFETMVALAACARPRFYDLIGYAIDPDRMPSPESAMVVQAAQAVARDAGSCPSATVALQHVRRLCDDGKVSFEQFRAAEALLDLAEDLGGIEDLDALVTETVPIVQRAAQQTAIHETIKDYGQGNGVDEAAERFDKIASLGRRRRSTGSHLSVSSTAILEAVSHRIRDPLPTGISELDHVLGGGLERGAMGLVLGGTGDGKSLFLAQAAAEAFYLGYKVAYLTLELSEHKQKSRLYANLTDMTAEEMFKHSVEAARRVDLIKNRKNGELVVCYSSPKATTPAHVRTWLRDIEQQKGFAPDVIVIDYIDRMVSAVGGKKSTWADVDDLSQSLHDMVDERDCWLWTASQTNRSSVRKKKPDVDSVADGMGKVRLADVVVAISRTDEDCEQGMISFSTPKHREGEAHRTVGPMPMDAARGRITTIARSKIW